MYLIAFRRAKSLLTGVCKIMLCINLFCTEIQSLSKLIYHPVESAIPPFVLLCFKQMETKVTCW